MKNNDVAIVGMSCYAPGAKNIDEYWNNLVNGVDSITDAPPDRIDPRYFENDGISVDRFYCKRGGFVPDITFDPIPYSILPVAIEGMDTAHLLALKMVYEALENASVFEKKISLEKSALIIGKGNYVGSAILRALDIIHFGEQSVEIIKSALPNLSDQDVEKIKKAYQKSRGRYQADSMPGLIPNLIASLIANKLDMHGPAYTIDAACASSLIAIEHAVNELNSGRCDVAIAGGVHIGQNATFWSIFSQLGALSHKQTIAPFSKDADGLLIGEGSGFVVLKKLEKAVADKDNIYALIRGIGVSSDGSGVSVMAPSAKGQKLAIDEAWLKSGLDRNRLGYMEAHGTATIIGDKTEITTLSESFPLNDNTDKILLGSVKSNIGHAMPAAGILGLIKTALALYNRQIPPTLHCKDPIKDINNTRFQPIQKLENWDDDKYPLIAGVNAFGFGGINAHVILSAYEKKEKIYTIGKSFSSDKVLVFCASTKESLIDKLKQIDTTNQGNGDYRLVLFDPTPERIEKAIRIIAKDKPWKGRQDIWFSNDPLASKGGKIVFLYPGFDPTSNPEIESVINHFKLDIPEEKVDNNRLLDHTLKLYRCSEIMNIALEKLNLKADMNAGHSLGEWFGIEASGMISSFSVKHLLESIDPEEYKIKGVYFIAVGCGKEKLSSLLDTTPDLYLSNDNCPNQVLLCGTEEAVNTLIPYLREKQIFYQILTFQSGFHTPFIKHKLHLLEEVFGFLDFKKATIPMWSCNSLDIYPDDPVKIKELSVKHLLEQVRFRELIEKLYHEQQARIFIQVGSGSLTGFVDDILSGQSYSAISMTTHLRSTLDQIRRIMALMYIEGKDVDMEFLNPSGNTLKKISKRKEFPLKMCMDIMKDFPLLKELSSEYKPLTEGLSFLAENRDDPVIKYFNENVNEMISMQHEVANLFKNYRLNRNDLSTVKKEFIDEKINIQQKTGIKIEEDLYVSMDTHPAIIGHSLVKQPTYWTCIEDLNPVIPMTMTFELLAEAANKQDLSRKVIKIGPISVFQWMPVDTPFIKKITGVWKSEDTISLGIKGYAQGEVTLGSNYPKSDQFYENEIDLGENIRYLPSKDAIYQKYMFHGPGYQGIEKVINVTEKGIRTYIRKQDGKGSLLDNAGQSYGLYLQLVLDVNYITFPVKVHDITFYQDMHDQDGLFECVCLSKSITDDFTNGEVILKRDGKLWCVIKGWQNRRFEFDDILWQITLCPGRNLLANEIAPGIFHFNNKYEKPYILNFLMKRYLNQPEKRHYELLPLNKRKDYLISRIVLKDALRSYVQDNRNRETYPIEYFIKYDENHKPYVYGIDEVKGLEISLAHKSMDSVCIVSDKPVGIDIEIIEDRGEAFMKQAFTKRELDLLNENGNIAKWATCFWVAKEAYSKKIGIGLKGDPKRYEVKNIIDEQNLVIEDCNIRLLKHKKFIIGWTI